MCCCFFRVCTAFVLLLPIAHKGGAEKNTGENSGALNNLTFRERKDSTATIRNSKGVHSWKKSLMFFLIFLEPPGLRSLRGRCIHLAKGQPALPARFPYTKRLTRIPLRLNAHTGNDGPWPHQPLSEAEWM